MRAKGLYVSDEARASLLARYEELLARWREVSGLELERQTVPTAAGKTAVFAFGPGSGTLGEMHLAPRGGGSAMAAARPPLLLLHGTLSNSCIWLADAAALGADRRVYAVDIPGEPGLSEERPMDWQGSGAAAWLAELVAGLSLEEHDLAGLSIGGWMGLRYAIERPKGLCSLALLSPSGLGRTKTSFLFKAMLQMPRGKRGYEAVARSLYGEREPPEGAIKAGAEFSMSTNARMESPRLFTDEELGRIEARLLLLVGEKDAMLHSRESAQRLKAARPEADVRLLPGAGHALMGMGPMIADFLARG
jgi:Predicted hydrolases or acyltransferases (alpha/beta hydrolase superfamily)